MSTKDFLNIGLETTKGSALHSLKDEGKAGAQDFAIINLTGAVSNGETFTLGEDVYEVAFIATDRGLDTGTGGEYNNTAPGPIQVPLTSAQVAVGDILNISPEFFKVTSTGPNSSTVVRGYAGSTITAHGNSVTILENVTQIAATSQFAVPTGSSSAASMKVLIAKAINFFSVGVNEQLGKGTAKVNQASLIVEAFVGGGTDAVVFHVPATPGTIVTAETLANGTITVFGEGIEAASQKYSTIWRVVTAAEASAGLVRVVSPFDVTEVVATVFDATGALKVTIVTAADVQFWNGGVSVVDNRLIEVANAGSAVWLENDIIKIEFFA